GIYSYERRPARLPEPYRSLLKKNRKAWAFLDAQPPGYKRSMAWWIVSAKKEETRLKRFGRLARESAAGRRIPLFTRRREK
ncbi:MAG TPA: YdeI/OmpD-associated family protein, partial [Thermoanaerobaculia bacterium]